VTSKSSVATTQERRAKLLDDRTRRERTNELLGLYIQLGGDSTPSEKAALRQCIYDTIGVAVVASVPDEAEAS
jgi:hypothetical protein